jgi:hypothetical protein
MRILIAPIFLVPVVERIVQPGHIKCINHVQCSDMTGSSQERAGALRRETAWCLEQAKVATTQARRDELIALAASFNELANTSGTSQPATQQQQQIQPKKEDE